MLSIILVVALFNGDNWEMITQPMPMKSIQECTTKAAQILEELSDYAKDVPVSADCRMGMGKEGNPA